ncbi:GNAT family N-acetyltransferase [Pinibacter soli]|uniref:GNAT family N-acetyltransferase n=1 Tax=Pinibacter soli TaxID=3044211 RepID=A0ABT6RE33_9BACT|nr:GNAT family N-acetyltransferase [Pinibacter soli]MDI3320655.1 GNAT family N-acetyltransferase [Pinibacter soli]
MENIEIKPVTKNDVADLQKISIQTFTETFAAYNTEENMAKYLREFLSFGKLSEELDNAYSTFYFATLNNSIIGYVKLNFSNAQTELQDSNGMEIERIYVLQEYFGKSVGQVLFEKARQVAEEKNLHYMWLGVWEKNPRAISFYKKNGFIEFDKHIFKLGEDEQTDIMMKKILNNGKSV